MTGGMSGDLPDYFIIYEAADIHKCPAWELLERPQYWIDTALAYNRIKINYQRDATKHPDVARAGRERFTNAQRIANSGQYSPIDETGTMIRYVNYD